MIFENGAVAETLTNLRMTAVPQVDALQLVDDPSGHSQNCCVVTVTVSPGRVDAALTACFIPASSLEARRAYCAPARTAPTRDVAS